MIGYGKLQNFGRTKINYSLSRLQMTLIYPRLSKQDKRGWFLTAYKLVRANTAGGFWLSSEEGLHRVERYSYAAHTDRASEWVNAAAGITHYSVTQSDISAQFQGSTRHELFPILILTSVLGWKEVNSQG